MEQKILCEVNNCSYWGKGNKCTADAIYVVSHTGETAETARKRTAKRLSRMICNQKKELHQPALSFCMFSVLSFFVMTPFAGENKKAPA